MLLDHWKWSLNEKEKEKKKKFVCSFGEKIQWCSVECCVCIKNMNSWKREEKEEEEGVKFV